MRSGNLFCQHRMAADRQGGGRRLIHQARAQQQRFTLQGLQSAAADTADHLEICAQLISHKQHQKTLAQIMAQMGVQQNVTSVHWRVGEA